MPESEFDKTYGSDARTGMVANVGQEHVPVDDVTRNAMPGEPPVVGAQWDEVHRRWEVWDEDAQEWNAIESPIDSGIAPADENPLPPLLARELVREQDIEANTEHLGDAPRAPEPDSGPEGAQWNEVLVRWERWDEDANAWVEAT